MDNATFQKIKDTILKHQDVGVIVRPNPSLDEMAAGLGMYLVLSQMGKNASIACPTDPIVAISSLVGINRVQKTLGGGSGGDLTVSFPYKEGEIEKVSYTLDDQNKYLNIVVKAGEKGLSFQDKDIVFKRSGKAPSLLFFVGVPRISDVVSVYTPQPNQEVSIVNIDNKQENEKYGEIVVVDTKWSSVSEQIADFVTLLEPQIELERDTAQNLLDGIDYATNDFTSPQTSYLAFEVAGILMKKGATRQHAQNVGQRATVQPNMPVQDTSAFFPPQPQFRPQPMQQPVQQPVQQLQQTDRQQPSWQPAQPVTQPSWQPTGGNMPQPQQNQADQQNPGSHSTPPDWLTPKVYKGSTIL